MRPPSSSPFPLDDRPLTLIGQLRRAMRLRRYSLRTEEAYVGWVRRFVRFHGRRHPRYLGVADVRAFLTDLAVRGRVSASTQNQARAAVLFLYSEVLRQRLPWQDEVARAKRPVRLPVVLTRAEVAVVLAALTGSTRLVAILLYGAGLRLMEAVSLRVKDVDFGSRSITVRGGKGQKDRVTVLPEQVVGPLRAHLAAVERLCRTCAARCSARHPAVNGLGQRRPQPNTSPECGGAPPTLVSQTVAWQGSEEPGIRAAKRCSTTCRSPPIVPFAAYRGSS